MARVPVYPSSASPDAVEGTCDQRRLRSDYTDARADRSLRWTCMQSYEMLISQYMYSPLSAQTCPGGGFGYRKCRRHWDCRPRWIFYCYKWSPWSSSGVCCPRFKRRGWLKIQIFSVAFSLYSVDEERIHTTTLKLFMFSFLYLYSFVHNVFASYDLECH